MKQEKYKKIKYALPICKMLQKDLRDFMNEAIENEINQYLDSKGKFNPRLGIIMSKKGKKENKKCLILDTNILMFGKQYAKVFVDEGIIKVSADRVKRMPAKKNKDGRNND